MDMSWRHKPICLYDRTQHLQFLFLTSQHQQTSQIYAQHAEPANDISRVLHIGSSATEGDEVDAARWGVGGGGGLWEWGCNQ